MTTPSAKADGFLGHARSNLPRYVPNAQSERTGKDITGSVDISVNDQPAGRTGVNTVSKSLRNIRQGSTSGAYLRGPVGVNLNQHAPGFFHLVGELGQERTPSCIIDRLRQHTSGQSADIQVLDSDKPVAISKSAAELMLEVRSLIPNMNMNLLKESDRLPAAYSALLAPGNFPLTAPEFCQPDFEATGIGNQFAVREGGKGINSHVNANSSRWWDPRRNINSYRKAGVPPAGLSLESEGLNFAGDRPVQLQLDGADPLYLDPAGIGKVTAVSPGRESVAVESVPGFEAGIAGFLTGLHTAEESLESLIHPPEHVLAGGEVGQVKVAGITYLFKLVGLVVVITTDLLHTPGFAAFLERGVVQGAGLRKLVLKGCSLLFAGIQAVFEGLTQKFKPSFTSFATRYNDKAGIGRLHSYYIKRKEAGQFLCQLKQAVPLP